MTRINILKPVYVQYIPPTDSVEEGKLYISSEFQTVIHKCCCGCGEEVVTPLNSAQWQITNKDGQVSLFPSIGNWSYTCKSHYFIRNNRVIWAEVFSEAEIKIIQEGDRQDLERYIAAKNDANYGSGGLLQPLTCILRFIATKVRDLIFNKKE